MTDEQIAAVARELSEAQRVLLFNHHPSLPSLSAHWASEPVSSDASWSKSGRTLMANGLIKWEQNPRANGTVITGKGLAVRRYLQEQV